MKRAFFQAISHIAVFALVAAFASGCAAPKKATPAPPKPVTQSEIKNICDGKTPKECNDTGVKFENSKDYERAKLCYQKACDSGEGVACSNLGSLYQKIDPASDQILPLFLKACQAGNKYGCFNAANVYRLGLGARKNDFVRAIKLYEKSCVQLKHAKSCTNLGSMHQFSLGVETASRDVARKFYEIGCELGDEVGCRNLSLVNSE